MATTVLETQVAPEWVDYNGHMNDAEYARVFSLAVDAFWETIGLDGPARQHFGVTTFTLEAHLCYLGQTYEHDPLTVTLDILDRDAKRFHLFFGLYRDDGALAATSEQMLMAIDPAAGRATAFPEPVVAAAEAACGQLDRSAWPEQAGRTIGIRRR
ncbi:thioesterase family protein [Salinisphaera sp. SPP-AMP-43]|uniref:thioesterase family protein n=1 Tax=Salinisphaera sp. SPP-AMP-43 TaxID=3121288 RepID=UPI003C6DDE7F